MNEKASFLDTLIDFALMIGYVLVSFSYLTFLPFLIIFILILILEYFVKISVFLSVVTYVGSMLLILVFVEFFIVLLWLSPLAYYLLYSSLQILEWCVDKKSSILFDINLSLFMTFLNNAVSNSPPFLVKSYRKNLNYLRHLLLEFKENGIKTDKKSIVLLRNQIAEYEIPVSDRIEKGPIPIINGLFYWTSLIPVGVLTNWCMGGAKYAYSRVIKPGAEDALRTFVKSIVLLLLIIFGLKAIRYISPEISGAILDILKMILAP